MRMLSDQGSNTTHHSIATSKMAVGQIKKIKLNRSQGLFVKLLLSVIVQKFEKILFR